MTNSDIIASVELFATDAGGRTGPTPPDKFHCLLKVEGEFFDCRILLANTGPINPGGSAVVPIALLNPQMINMRPGSKFAICDGFREVGSGTVLKVQSCAEESF